jgi:hypothetical protein
MQTSVEIEIGNGVYPCAIGLQGVLEIETACGAGVGEVIARLLRGRGPDLSVTDLDGPQRTVGYTPEAGYRVKDAIEFVRQGLIGAAALGLKPTVDGVPQEHATTPSRANAIINNYLLPPNGSLNDLWNYAAFIALNLAEGYVPPEKKSPSVKAGQ